MKSKTKLLNYPCTFSITFAPAEVEATLAVGEATYYALVPISKIDQYKNTIQLEIVGAENGNYVVMIPGEVQNGTTMISIPKSLMPQKK